MPEVGGRGRRGRRVSTSLSEINVIPLVDVMLVLLIIFMVAAPMLQRGIEVNLPVARQTQKMTEERLYITVPLTFRKDRRVYGSTTRPIAIDVLAERIRQAMLDQGPAGSVPARRREVQAQELLDVFDRLKEGGIEKVGHRRAPGRAEHDGRRHRDRHAFARARPMASQRMVGASMWRMHVVRRWSSCRRARGSAAPAVKEPRT